VLKQIVIRNRTYTLKTDDNEAIELVAADIEHRMKELSSRSPVFDEYTLALLTAMNLASELHALKKRLNERLGELDRKTAALEALLEAAATEPVKES
jgi:cell division protein ZapA (FtsZ GTPase activity inhibitor)